MRLPRIYRGKDSVYWLGKMDFFDQTVGSLPSPKERFIANPFLSGKGGGRSLNLHRFARDGVVFLGRLQDAEGTRISLAPDLYENLTRQDEFVTQVKENIDAYIADNQIKAQEPREEPDLRDGYDQELVEELDLAEEGISTIIWATGFQFDFSWVRLPVQDVFGYPVQKRGITGYPGFYFLGLHWLYKRRSGLPWGVGEGAAHIAADIQTGA